MPVALDPMRLGIVGLGVVGDQPPHPLQPGPLVDGVHLRWQFGADMGFPFYGFYLYRRETRAGKPICLSPALGKLSPGPWSGGSSLATPVGTITSDRPLVLTDDFPGAGVAEIDLDHRDHVTVELFTGQEARSVEVTVGLRGDLAPVETCIDFKDVRVGPGPNPFLLGGATFVVRAADGSQRQTTIKDWRTVGGMGRGLDCGVRTVIRLPCPADSVSLTLTHYAEPGTVAALDAHGRVVDTAAVTASRGQIEVVRLRGAGIVMVAIDAKYDQTALHRLCFVCHRDQASVRVTALSGPFPVRTVNLQGAAGAVVHGTLTADRITAVRVSSGPAALIELCIVPVVQELASGWAPLLGAPDPICLPVRHNAYPCSPGPEDRAASKATALGRIRYGPPPDPTVPWEGGEEFDLLYDWLRLLVQEGPSGTPMAQQTTALDGVSEPPDPTIEDPDMPDVFLLDFVLLAALDPAIAQMLGLYWVDQTADPVRSYDYMVVADYPGVGGGSAASVLQYLYAHGFGGGLDVAVAFGLRKAMAAPLQPPSNARVYALPAGPVPLPGTTSAAANFTAALTWPLPVTDGLLAPGSSIMYHVWRAGLGNAVAPSGAGAYVALTGEDPILIGPSLSGEAPTFPAEWPPFPLQYVDRGLAEGWYGYELSGVDIFGRHSARSAPASWREWAPMPTPRPWYYVDPPSDTAIHPSAVRLLDKLGPPMPTAVEAYALDPLDPFLLRDPAYDTWFNALTNAEQGALVGLRVRWRWTQAHMDQAPDTAEFRIYYHPGSQPPAEHARPTTWDTRYYVVPYNTNFVTVADDDGLPLRQYEVFIPATGDARRDGVPLVPIAPAAYANVGVSAADDKQHTPDDPKWAAGNWGGRVGNEGPVGPPAVIFVVPRIPPDPPSVPPAPADRIYASAADYYSHSFYTYRWLPLPPNTTHIYRAVDDALFKTDWARRGRNPAPPPITAADPIFPTEPRWNQALRDQVVADLNVLGTFARDAAGAAAADAYYRGLSDDALRVLAGLPGTDSTPGNELAFSQLTITPLDPADPATADRLGPDNVDGWPIDPINVRAFIDTLDGRSTNRYFYRAAYVDGAYNTSDMSLASPPIYLPDTIRPVQPRPITPALGGDRRITLRWEPQSDRGLERFFVFRTDDADRARNVRRMGSAVASLPARELRVDGGAVELGADTDAATIERVYEAATFDPGLDLLVGQTAAHVLLAPTAPAAGHIGGLTAADGTPVVVVYRDSVGELQHTPAGTRPRVWVDGGRRGARNYYYRVVAQRLGAMAGGFAGVDSEPSAVVTGRAIDLTPPAPPAITTLEWVRVRDDGIVFPFAEPIPVGETRAPAVRVRWSSPDASLASLVQYEPEATTGFINASPSWLPRGRYEYVHRNGLVSFPQRYRIKVVSEAGNANVNDAPADLPPVV